MDFAESTRLLDLVAETANGVRLEFLNNREDCSVYFFMFDLSDDGEHTVCLHVSFMVYGERVQWTLRSTDAPSVALAHLSRTTAKLSLEFSELLSPKAEELDRAWSFLHSAAYHEAIDLALRDAR